VKKKPKKGSPTGQMVMVETNTAKNGPPKTGLAQIQEKRTRPHQNNNKGGGAKKNHSEKTEGRAHTEGKWVDW